MDDPVIEHMERTGFPDGVMKEHIGEDFFGNEIYPGDEVYEYDGDLFLQDTISGDLEEFLNALHADRKVLQ